MKLKSNSFTIPLLILSCLPLLLSKEILGQMPVIGIDLGTTYSVVGVMKNGNVEIIANELGNRITPSWVAFTDTERLIGESAKNQASMNPENTIFGIKRIIGRKFNDPEVARDMKLYPFKVVNRGGNPFVEVTFKGSKQTFSPEEISAMILTKMKETAEAYLGKKVQNAVITCPAYFTDAQRQATKDAGTIAGLNVFRIINEPTAAAIAYGLADQSEKERTILVFDLGGGTFDVTLLTLESGFFEVKATNGDTHLGGEDFDQRVQDYLLKVYKKKTGKDASMDKRAVGKLKREVERAKKQLSTQHQAKIEIESFHDGDDLSETITRAKFEELNADLFKKTLVPVENVLKDAKVAKNKVDEIVLVGGSTRIPKIQQLLKDYFGKEPNRGVNPDEAVAYGAAVQGGIMCGEEKTENIILIDRSALTLGIETAGGILTPIIPRNTQVPAKKSQVFTTTSDNQEKVVISVYEGERSLAKDNHLLGRFELTDIPPSPRGTPQIEVTFEYDVSSILSVHAVEKLSGKEASVTIEKDRLSKDEIQRLIEEAEEAAEEDRKIKQRIEEKNKLENYAYQIKNFLENSEEGKGISSENRASLEEGVQQLLQWIDQNPNASKEEYEEKYNELDNLVKPIMMEKYNNQSNEDEPINHDEL